MAHQERQHALLSASGAHRWMNCAPSARLEEKLPDSTSVYAEEGTLAHEISEVYLRAFREGKTEKDTLYSKLLTSLRKNPLYNDEMEDHVAIYVDFVKYIIKDLQTQGKSFILDIEKRLDYSHLVERGYGTGDVCIITDNTLYIIDLKFGKGVKVEAKNNAQMMLYASGAAREYGLHYELDKVKMVIVQPRMDNISEHEIRISALEKWGEEVVRPAAEKAYSGEGEKKAGSWCKFCKVKALCKTLAEENMKLAKYEFADPNLLTVEELALIFKQQPMLVDWVNSIEEYLLKQAKEGVKIPGYKLVEGRSNRRWINEQMVAETLTKKGYSADQFTVTKLANLTAIEKLVGKADFGKVLGNLVEKPQGAPTLADENDKRPAFGLEQAKEDFKD